MSLGALGNWPESKVLHIKQNRLILLPARSINMQEYGLWKPVAIGFRCSELPSQGLILDPDVYETKQWSVYHLFMAHARLWGATRAVSEQKKWEFRSGNLIGTHGGFLLYVWIIGLHIYVPHACLVPLKTRRGHQIP